MTTNTNISQGATNLQPGTLREAFADAFRFWEPRRILYNVLLTAVVLLWVALTWPHFQPDLHLQQILALGVLALLANLCYCAAYLVEASMLGRNFWKNSQRWGLWIAGTLFALLLANYWIANEIYSNSR